MAFAFTEEEACKAKIIFNNINKGFKKLKPMKIVSALSRDEFNNLMELASTLEDQILLLKEEENDQHLEKNTKVSQNQHMLEEALNKLVDLYEKKEIGQTIFPLQDLFYRIKSFSTLNDQDRVCLGQNLTTYCSASLSQNLFSHFLRGWLQDLFATSKSKVEIKSILKIKTDVEWSRLTSFYKLLKEFPLLVHINLSFPFLSSNTSHIRKLINLNDDVKNICQNEIVPILQSI